MSANVFSFEKVYSLSVLTDIKLPLSIKILTKAVDWLIGRNGAKKQSNDCGFTWVIFVHSYKFIIIFIWSISEK